MGMVNVPDPKYLGLTINQIQDKHESGKFKDYDVL